MRYEVFQTKWIYVFSRIERHSLLYFLALPLLNPLRNISTTTKIYHFPNELTKGTINFIPHTSNNSTSRTIFNGLSFLLDIPPYLWHCLQVQTNSCLLEVQTCHAMRNVGEFLIEDWWNFEEIENRIPE